jgi:hypothetical protein
MQPQEPLLYPDLHPVSLVTPARAMTLKQAAETLRIMGGEQARQCRRDPTLLLACLADILDLLADEKDASARCVMRQWAAVDRAGMSA